MFIYKKAAPGMGAAGFPGGGVAGVVLVHATTGAAGAGRSVCTVRAIESHVLCCTSKHADI